jgi:hypothetical protein
MREAVSDLGKELLGRSPGGRPFPRTAAYSLNDQNGREAGVSVWGRKRQGRFETNRG